MSDLAPGLSATLETTVEERTTAAAFGSGLVSGFATPAMIAVMEGAAVAAVAPHLDPGTTSVGTRVDVSHTAPTPVGMRVSVRATLETVEGRRLLFSVVAHDEAGEIGVGSHERYLVDLVSFEEKIQSRGR